MTSNSLRAKEQTTECGQDDRTQLTRHKLRSHVHRGHCKLQPLLGEFKPARPADDGAHTVTRCYSNRLLPVRFSATDGPADIEYLKNKMGFCIPSEEHVLRSQRFNVVLKSQRPPLVKPVEFENQSTADSVRTDTRKSYNDSSKSTQRLIKEHLTIEAAEEKIAQMKLSVDDDNEARDIYRLEHILNMKVPYINPGQSIINISQSERRQRELKKIVERARRTSLAHDMLLERKLSTFRDHDEQLSINVRSQLELVKLSDRTKKYKKISRLESKRYLMHTSVPDSPTTKTSKHETINSDDEEQDEIYQITSQPLIKRSYSLISK